MRDIGKGRENLVAMGRQIDIDQQLRTILLAHAGFEERLRAVQARFFLIEEHDLYLAPVKTRSDGCRKLPAKNAINADKSFRSYRHAYKRNTDDMSGIDRHFLRLVAT